MWAVLGALLVLLLVGLIWCFTGNILTTAKCKGIYNNGTIYAYLPMENASQLKTGLDIHATVGDSTVSGSVTDFSSTPVSQAQASQTLNSPELAAAVVPTTGGVEVAITCSDNTPELGSNALSNVEIVLSDIRPIDLILQK